MSSATPPGPASRDRRIVAWPLAAAATALAFLLALSPSAGAAIALVKNLGTNGNTTSGKTLAINPSSTVAVGDTVIVTFAMDPDSGTVSCADSKGNPYGKDADKTNGSGTSGVRTVIFSAPVTTALATTDSITVTLQNNVAAKAMSAAEFSGLATAAFDKTASAMGTSTTPS